MLTNCTVQAVAHHDHMVLLLLVMATVMLKVMVKRHRMNGALLIKLLTTLSLSQRSAGTARLCSALTALSTTGTASFKSSMCSVQISTTSSFLALR
jgi:hypothetical protein